MIFGEEGPSFMGITLYSICLFVVMFLCHYIPKMTHMGKKGEKWMIIIFFGLLIGVAFNITIPGSLAVVTEAFEDYSNATETETIFNFVNSLRRLEDGDDDDDDDDNFRRIIGVAICLGFMILFLADFISKSMTKKQRENEVSLPVGEEGPVEKSEYTLCALKNFYGHYYVFAALGCIGAYLVCETKVQRAFILISQFICLLPTCLIYGRQLVTEKASSSKSKCRCQLLILVLRDSLLLSLLAPVCNILFLALLNLFHGEFAYYVISHGYPLFCGLVLYVSLMYFISLVHVEETFTSGFVVFFCMLIPYVAYLCVKE